MSEHTSKTYNEVYSKPKSAAAIMHRNAVLAASDSYCVACIALESVEDYSQDGKRQHTVTHDLLTAMCEKARADLVVLVGEDLICSFI